MKISVVISAHNRPDLLLEVIGSIAAQTHLNLEVVIVDEGSRPAVPLDQLKSHLGGNTIFLRHDKSRSVACTKNAGIKAATGEIITLGGCTPAPGPTDAGLRPLPGCGFSHTYVGMMPRRMVRMCEICRLAFYPWSSL